MIFIQDDPTLDDDDDDDDTQSVDFLSGKNGHHRDDDESLNSSRSSLQHPPPSVFKGVIITRQSSNASQPINPVYTGIPTNLTNNNNHRSSSVVDLVPLNQASSIQTTKNESNVQKRNPVRDIQNKIEFMVKI